MRKLIIFCMLLCTGFYSHAQILKKLGDKTKQKIEQKTNEKIDETTQGDNNNKTGTGEGRNEDEEKPSANSKSAEGIKTYSKYDFVPGEKVIGFEDFSTGEIGDFPAGWNTNGAAEIVTIDKNPGRWLMLTKPGAFVPEFLEELPEDFTFEFDLLHSVPFMGGNSVAFQFHMAELQNTSQPQNYGIALNRHSIYLLPGNTGTSIGTSSSELRKNGISEAATNVDTKQLGDQNNPVHVSIWRQKERVRVYLNEEKVWDVPKAILKDAQLNAIVFNIRYAEVTSQYYIGNLRLAIGAPDTRNKFVTEGKWVTHGILFDVNSATIKAESYGSLKAMANVLNENPDLKVIIIGHTDSDGNDASNLDLSKRRAASVRTMLAKEFGIDESRMETDGKGESEPIDKNDNPAGKANNRRVEFIKL